MLKLESESGTEIADSGFLIIYEKSADSGSRFWIRSAIPGSFGHNFMITKVRTLKGFGKEVSSV